jgi:spermidine/putrescine-binding protein
MEPEDSAWLRAMEEYFGEQKTNNPMTALARQDIQWRKSHAQMPQLLAAGEFDLALVYAHTTKDMKKWLRRWNGLEPQNRLS